MAGTRCVVSANLNNLFFLAKAIFTYIWLNLAIFACVPGSRLYYLPLPGTRLRPMTGTAAWQNNFFLFFLGLNSFERA
jgi:hypothetical protein